MGHRIDDRGLAAYLVAAYEHLAGHSLTAFVWVTLGLALFMVGTFLAWNEQFNKAMLAGNPEILIEYEKSAKHITAALMVKNLGGGNAVSVRPKPSGHERKWRSCFRCGHNA